MDNIKILHTADWHFDSKFSGILSPVIRRERQLEQRKTFKYTINLAIQENVDLFLIAGDLFEQNSFTIETINFIISALKELKCPILITPGNHDPYINESPYKLFDWGPNVFIYSENSFIPFKYKNTEIYGIANTIYKDETYCLRDLNIPPENDLKRIVMFHGTYIDFIPFISNNDVCFPFSQEDIKKLHVQYIALGHFHEQRGLNIPDIPAYYSGTPEGINSKERGDRFAILAEISLSNCKVERNKVNQRSFEELCVDITGIDNQDSLYEKLRYEILKSQQADNLLYIILFGTLSFTMNLKEIESLLGKEFYYIRLKNDTISAFNIEELKRANTLVGDFVRKIDEKIKETNNEEEKIILNKAILYGLKALLGKEDIELE
ncbi:MAG: DNA repair exonuclease [Candidatus Firestonebacteria bacterium]|nr:DNA repair exonuclease [Candidatus Firestonebacteria bacterium]